MANDLSLHCLFFLLCSAILLPLGQSICLNLPSSEPKCVSEEIQNNVVVLADYTVVSDDETNEIPTISIKVTSPYGSMLHYKENATGGQFAFTTTESGNYLACFWMDSHHPHQVGASINIDWKVGIAAKDWEDVDLELRKLEGAVEAIHENFLYLRNREAEMREISEITNARVARCSVSCPSVSA